jgi:hypothetical protein
MPEESLKASVDAGELLILVMLLLAGFSALSIAW